MLLRHLPVDIEPTLVMFEDGEFAERMRGLGIATHVIDVPQRLREVTREKPSSAGAVALPGVTFTLARYFAAQRFDLIDTNTMKAHMIGSPAARLTATPALMHVRDMVDGLGRTALRFLARTCTRERIAISSVLARWYGLPRTSVIPNPVDLSSYVKLPPRADARRQLGIPDDGSPLLGIVGRINRWKGHDRFLRAAAMANAALPVRCAIIGEARFRDADFVPELHALAHDLGLGDRVTFVPWLDDPRIAYAALDVHCNASEREPFGRSIVEAAAAGVPTVAFDDGGAVDIIRNGEDGLLVRAGDIAALGSAFTTLVRDAAFRSRAGHAARQGSVRFEAPEHARRVAAVLRRAAGKAAVSPHIVEAIH